MLNPVSIKGNQVTIEEAASRKLLGITLYTCLQWDNQVDRVYELLNSRLNLFKRVHQALLFGALSFTTL